MAKPVKSCHHCGMAFEDLELTNARRETAEAAKKLIDVYLSSSSALDLSDAETHALGWLMAKVALLREAERG